jgi:hypothetical protein
LVAPADSATAIITLSYFTNGELAPFNDVLGDGHAEYAIDVEDEGLSVVRTRAGSEISIVGTPAGGAVTYYQMEISPLGTDQLEFVWEVARDGDFIIARWNAEPEWYIAALGEQRHRLQPPPAAVASLSPADDAQLPPRWPRAVLLTSVERLGDFLVEP